ncbi:hypothetical protein P3576_14275 [Vibrio parahaemolyticus]|uniref:hypothetical protein n=1 Tax=Vibrio harveyi group TaxID=717610 RepID=UPI0003FD0737|nr:MULTISPECIES: hypothetical protein [Vibrio harveyi group]EGQ7738122.1 hypothetical protein [Vibrio parahaemolyticus]EGQ8413948.1 hypothetical protein [Vibrio parahaemolyticus]EGQ8681384.1 hypothetical protein [Vibrio parahaemolyticus]EGQ8698559.1 hypothetical protein [Vibrio parahaemolyticus]EGQ8753800.1 hypothetical protein [Vibrio parahaemolyticus]
MSGNTLIKDILGTGPHLDRGKWSNVYQTLDDTSKHQAAVTVALELIKADVSASTQRTGSKLDAHLNNLGDYVQKIKAELDK